MWNNLIKVHTRTIEEAQEAYNRLFHESVSEASAAAVPNLGKAALTTARHDSTPKGINLSKIPEPKSYDGSYTIGRDW